MKVVLDTSAIIAGLQMEEVCEYLVTEEVIREIHGKNASLKVELAIEEGRLIRAQPDEQFVLSVVKKAQELGEGDSLSDADISTLSLALEIKERKEDVVIATDDYGIQNVAESLSLNYTPIAERGIKKILNWHFICAACGENYEKHIDSCEVCGNKVRRRVKKG